MVGNGQPSQAEEFRKKERLAFPLLVDPDLKAYRAAGLRRGVLSSLGPRVVLRGLRALRAGKFQGPIQGDPWQQGGVFVIEAGGQVLFSQVSKSAGDHAKPEDFLAALERAGGKKRRK